MRVDPQLEGNAVLVNSARRRGRDLGPTPECLALITEYELAAVDARLVRSLLLQCVLDLEEVGEVACGVDPNRQLDRLIFVIQDRQLLVEAVADGALSDHRELGIHIDGSGARH